MNQTLANFLDRHKEILNDPRFNILKFIAGVDPYKDIAFEIGLKARKALAIYYLIATDQTIYIYPQINDERILFNYEFDSGTVLAHGPVLSHLGGALYWGKTRAANKLLGIAAKSIIEDNSPYLDDLSEEDLLRILKPVNQYDRHST